MLKDVYDAGCRDFGENKVQEIMDKYPNLPSDIRWHMIGHLQTNKVKYIVDKVYMIHSVDSYKLAAEISKEAVKKNVTVKILIEVNVAGEESKFGTDTKGCVELIESIKDLPNIEICGLMTIAPYVEDSEENRPYFVILRELMVDIMKNKDYNIRVGALSMGMTGDYLVALSEGNLLKNPYLLLQYILAQNHCPHLCQENFLEDLLHVPDWLKLHSHCLSIF